MTDEEIQRLFQNAKGRISEIMGIPISNKLSTAEELRNYYLKKMDRTKTVDDEIEEYKQELKRDL